MKKMYIAPIVETEDMLLEEMISESSLAIDLTESGDEALVIEEHENLWEAWSGDAIL